MIIPHVIKGIEMQKSPEVKFFGFASANHSRQVEILRYDLPPPSQAHMH